MDPIHGTMSGKEVSIWQPPPLSPNPPLPGPDLPIPSPVLLSPNAASPADLPAPMGSRRADDMGKKGSSLPTSIPGSVLLSMLFGHQHKQKLC